MMTIEEYENNRYGYFPIMNQTSEKIHFFGELMRNNKPIIGVRIIYKDNISIFLSLNSPSFGVDEDINKYIDANDIDNIMDALTSEMWNNIIDTMNNFIIYEELNCNYDIPEMPPNYREIFS